ncbi:MAG: hypothetical protein LAP40_00765 [Acidobacteriia bacterium]|nr:hypothetical protein [Terriglobia bacterium]
MRVRGSIVVSVAWATVLLIPASGQAPADAPKQGVVSAGEGNAYRRAAQLPARIESFTAKPESIQPGEAVMLIWSTENPSGVTVEPGLGRVTARGSRELKPAATTTYTLTVRGPNNQTLTKEVTVKVAGTTPVAATAAPAPAASQETPRLNGKPDLSGVYGASLGGPGGRGGRGAAADGPALKPGAEKYRAVHGPDDPGLTADCKPLAGPQAFSVPYEFQIVQGAHSVAILNEYPGTFRIVPTDGATHPADPDPTWMGDSIGHWEGDTLVVDTVGFNDKTEISGFKHSEALHIVERFSRPTHDALQYEVTLDDPNVFVKAWKVTRSFALRPDLAKIDEFVCEANEDYGKYFKKE